MWVLNRLHAINQFEIKTLGVSEDPRSLITEYNSIYARGGTELKWYMSGKTIVSYMMRDFFYTISKVEVYNNKTDKSLEAFMSDLPVVDLVGATE